MREILLAALLAPLLATGPAAARAAPPPAEVTVTLGAALDAKASVYGPRELPELERDLQHAVAARAARGGFTRLELVLEDAIPNRPTAAMLGRAVRFDPTSLSRGGARVSGTAYGPGGPRPIRFSWWSRDLRDSAGAAIWTDAERAFQALGSELGRGRAPGRFEDRDTPRDWAASASAVDNPGGRR